MPDGPDEPGAAVSPPAITWREVDTPDLLEARLMVGDDGAGVYVGYVARSPGDDEWGSEGGGRPWSVKSGANNAREDMSVHSIQRNQPVWITRRGDELFLSMMAID